MKLKLLIQALIIILISLPGMANLQAQKFNSSTGNCAINFPSSFAKAEKTTANGMKTGFAKTKKDGKMFVFKYLIHNDAIRRTNASKFNEISALGLAQAMKGTQKKETKFNYKNYEGLETLVYISSKKLYVFYRVVLIGNIQYQFYVISSSANKNTDINNFFDSFTTLK